jgi:DNA helicase-2/ATP-dependent DNA helicase PcrA
MALSEVLEQLLDRSGYRQILADKTEQSRLLNIDELIQFVGSWQADNPEENFGRLLDRMAVDSGGSRRKKNNGIFLLTMHNAKGTEFPTVIVAGINQIYMPFFLRKDREEWEEERRLFYVAVTRGIQDVVVSDGSDRPSRFFREIDVRFYRRFFEVDDLFDRVFTEHDSDTSIRRDKPGGRYLAHPVFGKGRIVKSINEGTFLIEFEDGGEKVIDTSRVPVEFL